MAAERVIIQITGDTTSINSTISELEKLGKVDIKNADIFKRNNNALKTQYDQVNAKLAAMTAQMKELLITGQKVPEKLQKEYNSLKNAIDKVDNSFKSVGKGSEDMGKKVSKDVSYLNQQFNTLKNTIAGAFAVTALIEFGKESLNTAAKMQSISNSLNIVTGDSRKGAEALDYLRKLSERLGLDFESTADAFRSFAGATLKSGMTMTQTQKIFTQASMAITTMGLSSADASLALQAMSQIAGKGVASMEELRQQLGERIPGVLALTAEKMGYTNQEFNKLVSEGQILSKDILPAIGNALEEIGQGAEGAAKGMQGNLNNLKNMWTDFKDFFGANIIYPLVVGFKEFFIELPKQAYQELTRLGNVFKKKTIFDVDPNLSKSLENAQAQFIKFDVQLENAKTKESVNKIKDALFEFYKTLEQPVKDKIYNNYIDAIDKINERTKTLPSISETASAKLDAIIAKFKEFGEKAKTANTKKEILDVGRAVRDYYSSLEKGVKPEVKKYYYEVLDALKLQNSELAKASKQLTEYEKLVQAAKDTEEALQVLYTTGAVANTPLEIKLRSVLSTIEMINDRVQMAKNGMQQMQLTQGSERGGSLKPYLEAIKLGSQGQFDEAGKNILIKGEIGVVEKIIDGKKQLVYDYEQWLTEYMLQQAKDRNQSISDTNTEFDKIESDRKAQFFRDEEEKKKQIRQIELDAAMQVINIGLDYAYQAKQREYDYELQLLDNMLANKKITEEEYNRRKKEIQQKDAESQKEYSIFKATLDTANAILNALATGGTAAPALAIAAGVVGAAQIAAIAATPLPQYAEGTEFVALGKNKKGVDTIPALLNEGEAVITTEQNAMYPGMAKAWNDGKLDEHIYKKWVLPELIMNKSFEQQKQRSFAENVAKSIQLNQDFGSIESKLKRIDETEKQVGAMIVGAIKESKKQNIW